MGSVWEQVVRSGLSEEFVALAIWVALSVYVGLTRSVGGGSARSVAKRALRELSVLTHADEPGTFTVPRLIARLVRAFVGAPRRRDAGGGSGASGG